MTNPAEPAPIPASENLPVNPGGEASAARKDGAPPRYDAIIIGAGPGGLAAAIICCAVGCGCSASNPTSFRTTEWASRSTGPVPGC